MFQQAFIHLQVIIGKKKAGVCLSTLVVLSSFSLMACTQTAYWKPITSESRPPETFDASELIGGNFRFLMTDSSEVHLKVTAVSGQQLHGYQSNPYLPPDTLVVDLQEVLRIDRDASGLRPMKTPLVIAGVVLVPIAILILIAVVSASTEITSSN